MSSVLIDNWTIHNSVSLIMQSKYPHYVGSSSQDMVDDLENLIMSILLWDNVCFWDTENASVWKSFMDTYDLALPVHPVEIDKRTESLILREADTDLVSGGARKYQMLAGQLQMDYLPEKSREKYLGLDWISGDIQRINWQKYCVEQAKGAVLNYYDSVIGSIGDVELQFEFPLLLEYVVSEAGGIPDCLCAAQELRNTIPLHNMRLWIKNLHENVSRGNWKEVKYSVTNVKDIVSTIEKHSDKKAKFTLGISPSGLSPKLEADITVPLSFAEQRFQLSFLKDLVRFGLRSRPLKL